MTEQQYPLVIESDTDILDLLFRNEISHELAKWHEINVRHGGKVTINPFEGHYGTNTIKFNLPPFKDINARLIVVVKLDRVRVGLPIGVFSLSIGIGDHDYLFKPNRYVGHFSKFKVKRDFLLLDEPEGMTAWEEMLELWFRETLTEMALFHKENNDG